MAPQRYRKKPVVIEAIKLEPGTDNYKDVLDWITSADPKARKFATGDGGVVIETLEGNMEARPGDWVIRGVQGEFYPCKPEIFDVTYEPVED